MGGAGGGMADALAGWWVGGGLLKLSGEASVDAALRRLQLLPEEEHLTGIEGPGTWERGGGETYIYPFSVSSREGGVRSFLLKAAITFSPPDSLTDVLAKWVSR